MSFPAQTASPQTDGFAHYGNDFFFGIRSLTRQGEFGRRGSLGPRGLPHEASIFLDFCPAEAKMLLLVRSLAACPGCSPLPWEALAPRIEGWIVPAALAGFLSQLITPPLIVGVDNLQNTFYQQCQVPEGRQAVAGIISSASPLAVLASVVTGPGSQTG